jgi:hypothetical protein
MAVDEITAPNGGYRVSHDVELSPSVTKRSARSSKSGARRVSPGYFRLARAGTQWRYDFIGNYPV